MPLIELFEESDWILMHMMSSLHEEYFPEHLKMLIQLAIRIELPYKLQACLPMNLSDNLNDSLFDKALNSRLFCLAFANSIFF